MNIKLLLKAPLRAAVGLIAAGLLLGGCASQGHPRDPLEGFNRAVFNVNEGLDKALIKPVAQGYDYVVPLPGKTLFSNFFSNLGDPWVAVNNLLQAKPGQAISDVGRFLVNSTLGIGGAFDIASEMGLEKHEEDLGQTLGHWGVGDGPYVVLPIFGGRTTRDAFGMIGDSFGDPLPYYDKVAARNALLATRFVSFRAQLLPAEKTIDEAALDKYTYLRDAYLQRRRSLIYDGDPPRSSDDAFLEPDGPESSEETTSAAPAGASGKAINEKRRPRVKGGKAGGRTPPAR